MANLEKEYWFVSVPQSAKNKFPQVKGKVEGSKQGVCFNFELPDLRIGTLDTLVILSDQLLKDDRYVASVNTKLAKQLYDIKMIDVDEKSKTDISIDDVLTIGRANVESWLKKFKWDTGRWDYEKNSLKTITEQIQKSTKEIEDQLRIMQQEWSQVNNSVLQAEKSSEGSILIRDISDIVKKEHIINSETLVTILVVVSKYRLAEWYQTYETLVDLYPEESCSSSSNEGDDDDEVEPQHQQQKPIAYCVVPKSSSVIYEEGNEVLVNVTLFRKHVDLYKRKILEKKFQVRDFKYREGGAALREKKLDELNDKKNKLKIDLFNFCQTQFAEAFSCWIHLKSIRLWVESVLRYGLPANFIVSLIRPANKKVHNKLRSSLEDLFVDLGGKIFTEEIKSTGDEGGASFGIANEKMYSYVSMEVELHI